MNEQPTQDERTMATLAHVLQIVGGFFAPLIIFFLRPKSPFVRFHALQALLLQILYSMMVVGGMIMLVVNIVVAPAEQRHPGPPIGFFVMWFVCMALGFAALVLAIVYAIKASHGEWAAYPVVGGWARRMLHL
jgi:uncharacterized protein